MTQEHIPLQSNEEIRRSIMEIACDMEAKLRENEYKGGWVDCSCRQLFERLKEEVTELEEALFKGGTVYNKEVIKECADVGNFVMMIADKIRGGV